MRKRVELLINKCPFLALAEDYLQDYIRINVGSTDLSANHNIVQIVDVLSEYEKEPRHLHRLTFLCGSTSSFSLG